VHRELVRGLVQWNGGAPPVLPNTAGVPNTAEACPTPLSNQSGIFTPGPSRHCPRASEGLGWAARGRGRVKGAEGGAPLPEAGAQTGGAWAGDGIPSVEIDEGTFKYVLLRLTHTGTGRSKLVSASPRCTSCCTVASLPLRHYALLRHSTVSQYFYASLSLSRFSLLVLLPLLVRRGSGGEGPQNGGVPSQHIRAHPLRGVTRRL